MIKKKALISLLKNRLDPLISPWILCKYPNSFLTFIDPVIMNDKGFDDPGSIF